MRSKIGMTLTVDMENKKGKETRKEKEHCNYTSMYKS